MQAKEAALEAEAARLSEQASEKQAALEQQLADFQERRKGLAARSAEVSPITITQQTWRIISRTFCAREQHQHITMCLFATFHSKRKKYLLSDAAMMKYASCCTPHCTMCHAKAAAHTECVMICMQLDDIARIQTAQEQRLQSQRQELQQDAAAVGIAKAEILEGGFLFGMPS